MYEEIYLYRLASLVYEPLAFWDMSRGRDCGVSSSFLVEWYSFPFGVRDSRRFGREHLSVEYPLRGHYRCAGHSAFRLRVCGQPEVVHCGPPAFGAQLHACPYRSGRDTVLLPFGVRVCVAPSAYRVHYLS